MNILPKIALVGHRYEGTVSLPIWNDYRIRRRSSVGTSDNRKADFPIAIGGDDLEENPAIRPEHVNAYHYLTTHQEQVCWSILNKLLGEYENLKAAYDFGPDEAKELMPAVHSKEDFRKLIALAWVHVLNVTKDDTAYVGYEFQCCWDTEHGLGFMTHKNNVVAFGGADVSFLSWVAEKSLKQKSRH